MPLLGIAGVTAARLFAREAGRLYTEAAQAHPRRGRHVAHPDLDAAGRILLKMRQVRRRIRRTEAMSVFFPPGRQVDQVELALQRLREDPACTRKLSPATVDDCLTWRAVDHTAPMLLDIIAP